MKVLFAASDENISISVAKKYQKQFKEIISYKHVYFFDAILKELQINKNYDRIVISEELEEFSKSSSLEQKNKFIFDRLDSISDEAVASDGSDIPIILICSERRTKSEDILVKLFGIGIYNAVIGKDRTMEEVCRLINKPRSKKEAKIYYKIDSEDVNYEKESDSDVSEVEMQNIIMHFKKLGENKDRYADSFKNIVSQYNKEQLKVIIASLPPEVREVLSNKSPEYIKIVYPEGKKTVSTTSTRKKSGKKTGKKGTSEKLLETVPDTIMTKPVVVPATMKGHVYSHISEKKAVDIEDLEDEDLPEIDDIIKTDKPKRKRGRPSKKQKAEEPENKNTEEQTKRKRGRPRKKKEPIEEEINILPGFEDEEEQETFVTKPEIIKTANIPLEMEYDDEPDNHDIEDDYNDFSQRIDDTTKYDSNNYNIQEDDLYISPGRVEMEEYDNVFEDGEFEALLTSEKKIVTFVGTSKNGTSFIVNNVAQILADMGINTAILDATKNKSSYYVYTNDDEELRTIATNSIKGLIEGRAEGLRIKNNLTIYTGIPTETNEINNSHPILETIIRNHSLVLIDCDFKTPVEYFEKAQENYLVQSMDVLTIQPLTEFLRELQNKGVLQENKLRIVLNKMLKLRRITGNAIIGGMSKYNNADMSLMTDLFNAKTAKVAVQMPFDEDAYVKYLEGLAECEIKTNGYPKEIKARLKTLADSIYPLLPNDSYKKNKKKSKKVQSNQYSNSFSSGMNDTLNNMRNRY